MRHERETRSLSRHSMHENGKSKDIKGDCAQQQRATCSYVRMLFSTVTRGRPWFGYGDTILGDLPTLP